MRTCLRIALANAASAVERVSTVERPGQRLISSHDCGVTWSALRGTGLPSEGLGKIGLAVSPSDPNRVYAIVDAKAGGLYRSDDGGATWRLVTSDKRLWERGWYFCHVAVDPKTPTLVYVSRHLALPLERRRRHFTAIKGSPDGDDFHRSGSIRATRSRMVLASDQGTSVSHRRRQDLEFVVQPADRTILHVATDHAFPVPPLRRAAGQRRGA